MVFVLNKQKKPVNMCTEAKTRYLLKNGYALVHKIYPFTIRLKNNLVTEPVLKSYRVKIDPGSVHTGISIIDEDNCVVFLGEIEHRGKTVVDNLKTRQGARNGRRQRETRYRRCKWVNHYLKKGSKYKINSPRPKGWLPPSVASIEQNIINFIKKIKKLCNIASVFLESVKFDSQLLDNPNISGVEYQQGTLMGYEVREYLLEKYGHRCQYCGGESNDKVLEAEHMISKRNGGSDRIKNLNIACHTCNQDKGGRDLDEWLEVLKTSEKTKLSISRISKIEGILLNGSIHKSNRYSAWITSYRWKLVNDLRPLVDELELSSGGKTKYNRIQLLKLPKEHYYDSLCIGNIPESFKFKTDKILNIKAYGRGSRFRGRTNSCGVITNKNLPRQKIFFGYQTGDLVKAVVTKGKKIGIYTGRVAIRSTGYFNIQTKSGAIQGIKHDTLKLIQRNDGYSYNISNRNKEIV